MYCCVNATKTRVLCWYFLRINCSRTFIEGNYHHDLMDLLFLFYFYFVCFFLLVISGHMDQRKAELQSCWTAELQDQTASLAASKRFTECPLGGAGAPVTTAAGVAESSFQTSDVLDPKTWDRRSQSGGKDSEARGLDRRQLSARGEFRVENRILATEQWSWVYHKVTELIEHMSFKWWGTTPG